MCALCRAPTRGTEVILFRLKEGKAPMTSSTLLSAVFSAPLVHVCSNTMVLPALYARAAMSASNDPLVALQLKGVRENEPVGGNNLLKASGL